MLADQVLALRKQLEREIAEKNELKKAKLSLEEVHQNIPISLFVTLLSLLSSVAIHWANQELMKLKKEVDPELEKQKQEQEALLFYRCYCDGLLLHLYFLPIPVSISVTVLHTHACPTGEEGAGDRGRGRSAGGAEAAAREELAQERPHPRDGWPTAAPPAAAR
jgi:hypothetical protein